MTIRSSVIIWVLCVGIATMVAACTSGGSPESSSPATVGSQTQSPAGQPSSQGPAIEFRSVPDPPTAGDNAYEVTVAQADGSPVTDATVTAVFSMPAMPSMNMPAMRSEAILAHQGAGRYRGNGQLEMSGTWNVTVTVLRGTDEIGRRTLSVIAK